jgi:hypothetical protein
MPDEPPLSKSEELRKSATRVIEESKRLREVAKKIEHEADVLARKKSKKSDPGK